MMSMIAEISFHCFQIKLPEDYKLWLQTMGAEFPERFKRLFAGPMWSGMKKEFVGKPDKVWQLFLHIYMCSKLKALLLMISQRYTLRI